jgi:phosphoenolpyruvate synthase/pyruvate phosphate dikinase
MQLTKAENLSFLKNKLKSKIDIPFFIFFSVGEIKKNFNKIVNKILNFNFDLIFRSSSLLEDNEKKSNAGKYISIVLLKKNKTIKKIEIILKEIINNLENKNDQVIVQEYISDVDFSGVLFTEDKNSSAPYYIINYDYSGKTNLITGGTGKKDYLLIIYKYHKKIPNKFRKLIEVVRNIEIATKKSRLDIEFCVKNRRVYILQSRILPLNKIFKKKYNLNYSQILTNISKKIKKINKINPFLFGNKNILSNMSDWNPAEIIGDKPNMLSISLYSELITDQVWSESRSDYGYKNVYPNKLMYNLSGSPYIDLRCDINSYLPNDINDKLSKKIVNYYLNKLIKKPYLHDKLEFDVVETCFSFKFHKDLKNFLTQSEFTKYKYSLLKLTNNILSKNKNILKKEKLKSDKNLKILEKIKISKLHPINKIYQIISFCKKYGTLPFAGVARCAFISTKLILSLKEKKLINSSEISNFYSNLEISTDKINKFLNDIIYKKKTIKNFKNIFGHLRPQLYNINSPNYKSGFNLYYKNFKIKKLKKSSKIIFHNKDKINKFFLKSKLCLSFDEFIDFAIRAIFLREHLKFQFSKSIDEIFNQLKILASELKISHSDLCHLNIKDIIYFNNNLDQDRLKNFLILSIKKNKKNLRNLDLIKLPDLIINEEDVYIQNIISSKENFVTNQIVNSSEIYEINNIKKIKNLNDKVIFIKNADPGFDFIFNYKIRGLVTAYGGSNSHMSIRCLEMNIPAVIGIGMLKYNTLKEATRIYINCKEKILKSI